MAAERRKTKRLDLSGDYFYYFGNKKVIIDCNLKNISVTGACITSNRTINKDDIIFLHVRGADNMVLKSKAVWKIDNQYGLLFLLDSSHEFDKISYIMNYVIKDDLKNSGLIQ